MQLITGTVTSKDASNCVAPLCVLLCWLIMFRHILYGGVFNGLLIKLGFALLFHLDVEALMGSTNDPQNGGAVAAACLYTAIVFSVGLRTKH